MTGAAHDKKKPTTVAFSASAVVNIIFVVVLFLRPSVTAAAASSDRAAEHPPLAPSSACDATTASATTTAAAAAAADSNDRSGLSAGAGDDQARAALWARDQLARRLDWVLSGRRQRDVARWRGGDPPAASASDDPFPSDRRRLELLAAAREAGFGAVPTDNNASGTVASASASSTSSKSLSDKAGSLASQLQGRRRRLSRCVRLATRAVQLGWHFAPVWSTGLLAAASPAFRARYWYPWLSASLASSGPAFIKWGQWTATRPDLFPEALCDSLSALHSNAPAHSWKFSSRCLCRALGLATEEAASSSSSSSSPTSSSSPLLHLVFDSLDPIPIASGSIAQVHRATIGGKLVAIKIRHPNVERLMDLDFALMNLAAQMLDCCVPAVRWLHIRETIAQFGEGLSGQADLSVEANHLELLNHNFRNWPHVRFPQPLLATSDVIVETFEPGRVVTTFLEMYDRLADAINDEEQESGKVIVEQQASSFSGSDKAASLHEHLQSLLPNVAAADVDNGRQGEQAVLVAAAAAGGGGGSEVTVPGTGGVVFEEGGGGRRRRIGGGTSVDLEEGNGDTNDGGEDDRVRGYQLIPNSIAKFLVTTGLGIYLKMLLVDNLMHADLHPGNIMVSFHRHHPRNSHGRGRSRSRPHHHRHHFGAGRTMMELDDSEASLLAMVPHGVPYASTSRHLNRMLGICLVDAGMVARLTDHESSTFIGLLSSLGEGDGASAAEFALGFSLENNMGEEGRAAFARDMVELFRERCRGYGTCVDVGHVLRGILGLVRKHRVRIDANFATLVVNCLCVESLGRAVCPSYNVLDAARPLLQSYRRLYYRKDGTPKNRPGDESIDSNDIDRGRSRSRLSPVPASSSRLVRLVLSIMYVRKNLHDHFFFRREARRNKARTSAQRLLLEIPS